MEISKDKKYVSNGRPVRIIATDAKGNFPIIGLVTHPDATESTISFTADGKFSTLGPDPRDLVEVKESVTRYLIVNKDNLYNYSHINPYGYSSFEDAKRCKRPGETIVKVVFTYGEDQR